MPIFKSEAIVLKRINFAESDLIVTFFTKSFGKTACVAKRARKMNSPFGGRLEPFACVNIIYSGKEHQNLMSLRHCDIVMPFYKLREDYSRLTIGLYFTEIVNHFTREEQENAELYTLLLLMLDHLQRTENLFVFTIIFEMKAIAFSGFAPKLTTCLICKNEPVGKILNFHFQEGGVICGKCLNGNSPGRRINLGTLNYLKKALTINLDSIERLKLPKGLDKELGLITHTYLRSLVGKELKSHKFLHSLYS